MQLPYRSINRIHPFLLMILSLSLFSTIHLTCHQNALTLSTFISFLTAFIISIYRWMQSLWTVVLRAVIMQQRSMVFGKIVRMFFFFKKCGSQKADGFANIHVLRIHVNNPPHAFISVRQSFNSTRQNDSRVHQNKPLSGE